MRSGLGEPAAQHFPLIKRSPLRSPKLIGPTQENPISPAHLLAKGGVCPMESRCHSRAPPNHEAGHKTARDAAKFLVRFRSGSWALHFSAPKPTPLRREKMKSRTLMCITAMAWFAALAIPLQ